MIEPSSSSKNDIRRFLISDDGEKAVELVVVANPDIESEAALALMGAMIEKLRELDKWRIERERRSNLWAPDEFLPLPHCDAVLSGQMRELTTFAQRVARTTVNVLITGESGTGKEILARAIHDFSDRAQKPFVPFNCAAIPRDLLESQLFGHRRGAFTGADRDQLGLIRSAVDGTLFLDEIGEMSLDLQPKLLRFLESGEIAPLGAPAPLRVNVRVVAATNANLEDAVRDGKFREDLFYRLNVVRLAIKPLRERRDEIPAMIKHFVTLAARDYEKGHLDVAEDTLERLLLFRWPGNVRQLQNEIRRMVALAEPNSTLEPDAISPDILGAMPDLRHPSPGGREIAIPLTDKLAPTLSRIECEMIKAALRSHHGRLEPAAKALGISRKGLYLKRQRLGL
jgi:transcriptional regulator with PAS, ATPase and Fis domain